MRHSPVFCIAPWTALCVKADGNIVPDIQYKQSYGNILQQPLDEILRSPHLLSLQNQMRSSNFDRGCSNCERKEASGGRSRRTFFYDVLFEHIPVDYEFRSGDPEIFFLEMNTSNICNLKCRMCSGLISSSWIRDEIALGPLATVLGRPRHGVFQIGRSGVDRLLANPRPFRNLRFLALRGGEPLYEETNIYLLERIQDLGLASQVRLDISTNGTIASDRILKALEKFHCIDLYISLEGVGDAYSYIRGGKQFTLESLENNLKSLRQVKGVNFIFTFTSMVYNLGQIIPFWHWYNQVRVPGDEISYSNIVANPDYLSFHLLPRSLREKYHDEIDRGPIPKGPYNSGVRIVGDVGIESILLGLRREDYFDQFQLAENRRRFKLFNQQLDRIRGTSLKDVFPEIASFVDSIDESPHASA